VDDESTLNISDLYSLFREAWRRYSHICLPLSASVFLLGAAFCIGLPDYYSANSLIYLEPARVSSKVVEAPSNEMLNERLEALRQTILARQNLREVRERFKLFPEDKGPSGSERAMEKFKNAISVVPYVSKTGEKRLHTFRLEFSNPDPKMAFEVTKALTNLFIERSILDRRTEMKGTEDFLESRLIEVRKKLEATENEMQKFVSDNFGHLPDHLDQAVARLESDQTQLATSSEMLRANRTRLAHLETERADLKRRDVGAISATSSSEPGEASQETLARLETQLAVLTEQYTPLHPDVITTKKRIEAIRKQLRSGGISSSGSGTKYDSPGIVRLDREIKELQIEISSLEGENKRLRSGIEELQNAIEAMPLKEQELLKIKRDYNLIKQSYERLLEAREDASLQSSLVQTQKDAQFKVVEPPEVPVNPAGPNRLVIFSVGLLAFILILVGTPIAGFALNGGFKHAEELSDQMGIKVLGVIPPLNTLQQRTVRKLHFLVASAVAIVLFFGGVVVIFAIR